MELGVLGCFCAGLLACVISGRSILYALAFGLALFLLYGKYKGFAWGHLLRTALSGVRTIRKILLVFLLIGALTAVWRASGAIPVIICSAAKLIQPSIFYLAAFLLNCGVSVLTGTSFGAAATMGVVCTAMAEALRLNPVFTGGAVLSGIYFGDRWSPVSTSALLVCEVTGTELFSNLKLMARTALLPFLLSCGVYAALGLSGGEGAAALDIRSAFAREFSLHWSAFLPVAAILLLSAFRAPVKWSMLASILLAAAVCIFVQGMSFWEVCRTMVLGFRAGDPELAPMMNGGGVISMFNCLAIVCLSSAYSGLFRETGLLEGAKRLLTRVCRKATPFAAVLCAAGVSNIIGCSQTLSIMLTNQLCGELEPDAQKMAIDLEDSSVILAPLVPWSLASAVPLASIGASAACIPAACYLYLLPLVRLAGSFWQKTRQPAGKP